MPDGVCTCCEKGLRKKKEGKYHQLEPVFMEFFRMSSHHRISCKICSIVKERHAFGKIGPRKRKAGRPKNEENNNNGKTKYNLPTEILWNMGSFSA